MRLLPPPPQEFLYQSLGVMAAERGRLDEAREHFRAGVQTRTGRGSGALWQAWALMEQRAGNLEEARAPPLRPLCARFCARSVPALRRLYAGSTPALCRLYARSMPALCPHCARSVPALRFCEQLHERCSEPTPPLRAAPYPALASLRRPVSGGIPSPAASRLRRRPAFGAVPPSALTRLRRRPASGA